MLGLDEPVYLDGILQTDKERSELLQEWQAAPRAFIPRGRNPDRAEVKLTTRSTGPMVTHGKCSGRAQGTTDLSRNDRGAGALRPAGGQFPLIGRD